ncbi:MAG: hypothetical protein ACJ8CB_08970 [Ktedonobacteraceae bacterium]
MKLREYIEQQDTLEMYSVRSGSKVFPVVKLLKLGDIARVLLPVATLFLWFISLKAVDIRRMNDLGLVSVLPPSIIIALIILTISFCLTLRQPQIRTPMFLLHLVLLIFMLYSITIFVEQEPATASVYQRAGLTEYIMRTGSVDPTLDIYFNWSGFFILSAFVTQIAGYHDILSYAAWAPVFFNLIYLGPLYMIFTSATTDRRLAWLGLWFFCLTNWVEQDTFSPQGLDFFLYLVIIAMLLKWFKVSPTIQPRIGKQRWQWLGRFAFLVQRPYEWLTASDMLRTPTESRQRTALLVILLVIFAFVVSSHPLTPFFLIASVTALVFFRRCTPRWLPILMAAMNGLWIIFMAQAFLAGHSYLVLGNVGQVGSNVSANVTQRVVQGDAEHNFIAEMRVIMTGFIWLLACLGGVRRMRKGRRDITYILLAVAAFPLIVTQQYGGEMFLRIYLFTLPLIVFFAAGLFYTTHRFSIRGTSLWMTIAVALVSILLLGGFLFTRYGNENLDYMTYNEVASVHYLYSIAPPNSLLIEGAHDTPWQSQDYEKYSFEVLTDVLPAAVTTSNANAIAQFIEGEKHPAAYVIFTRGQKATAYSFEGFPRGTLERLEGALLKSGKFKLIYSNPDAQILMFVNDLKGGVS